MQLHKAETSVLDALRHTKSARFSELMRPTGLQSDAFKFHVRKLVKGGYVEKTAVGGYRLTAAGKEFANNLNDQTGAVQQQPKLSMLIVVPKPGEADVFLFQERRRSPYLGMWGVLTGPVRWGEDIQQTAANELRKQTGLTATCEVRALRRQQDYNDTNETLLEDKLFLVLEATNVQGELQNTWRGGNNRWMTLAGLESQPKHFADTRKIVDSAQTPLSYASEQASWSAEEY